MRKKVDYAPSADEQIVALGEDAAASARDREATAVCVAADPLFRLERDCGAARAARGVGSALERLVALGDARRADDFAANCALRETARGAAGGRGARCRGQGARAEHPAARACRHRPVTYA